MLHCGMAPLLMGARRPAFSHPRPLFHEAAKHRHHRSRRSWQDHPRRLPAAAVRRLPRQPARRRARDGLERSREGARHHDHGESHVDRLARHADQHRRHARPCRFRRRGRAHPVDGRWRDRAGRCRRGADAADQVRRRQGAEDGPEADRRRQQGRQAGRPHHRSGQRGVRPVRRARRDRRAARFPDPLRLRQAGLDVRRSRKARRTAWARCSTSC